MVDLDSVGVTAPNGAATKLANTNGLPVLFDSGTVLTYLPSSVTLAIAKAFNGQPTSGPNGLSLYIVDCSFGKQSGSVDYTFGSKTVKVPFKDLIVPDPSGVCILGIVDKSKNPLVSVGFTIALT
jgi:Eukaryotic aspartyl protease